MRLSSRCYKGLAPGIGGEVFFPESWRQFGDASTGMLADPLQDIDRVVIGMDIVEAARGFIHGFDPGGADGVELGVMDGFQEVHDLLHQLGQPCPAHRKAAVLQALMLVV